MEKAGIFIFQSLTHFLCPTTIGRLEKNRREQKLSLNKGPQVHTLELYFLYCLLNPQPTPRREGSSFFKKIIFVLFLWKLTWERFEVI